MQGFRPWVTLVLLTALHASARAPCERADARQRDGVYLGYTRASETTLQTFGVLHDGGFVAYDGVALSAGDELHGLRDGSVAGVGAVRARVHRIGEDRCVFQARLDIPASERWEIWSGHKGLADKVHRPLREEVECFQRHELDCVVQGDRPAVEPVACPELVAVSDVDGDGSAEYWHTVPYKWDTGLAVSEAADDRLVRLHTACPGCSD